MTINVLQYGADPTGVTSSVAAFRAAILAAQSMGLSTEGPYVPIIYCPTGMYLIDEMVEVDRAVMFVGAGSSRRTPGTEIVCPAGVTPFFFRAMLSSSVVLGASGGVMKDFFFRALGRDKTYTTGTISSGSNTLTVSDATDFAVNQLIRVQGANHASAMYGVKATTVATRSKILTTVAEGSNGPFGFIAEDLADGVPGMVISIDGASLPAGTKVVSFLQHVVWSASTGPLPACTAAGSGVGKTLAGDASGVLTVGDIEYSASTDLNRHILVKDQVNTPDNGIYALTTLGTASVPFVLTRATDFDQASDAEISRWAGVYVLHGSNAAKPFHVREGGAITVDTTDLEFDPGWSVAISQAAGATVTMGQVRMYDDLYGLIINKSGSVLTLQINGSGSTGATNALVHHADAAILTDTAVNIENISTRGFQGHAVHIQASNGYAAPYNSNANDFKLTKVYGVECAGLIYLNGVDVNNGILLGCDATLMREWAYQDSSQLGNVYIGCHVSGGRGYKVSIPVAQSTFLSSYAEGGTYSSFSVVSSVISGVMGSDEGGHSQGPRADYYSFNQCRFGGVSGTSAFSDIEQTYFPLGPRGDASNRPLLFRIKSNLSKWSEGKIWSFRQTLAADGAIGWWGYMPGNESGQAPMVWSDGNALLVGPPEERTGRAGHAWFPRGFFIGNADNTDATGTLDETKARRIRLQYSSPESGSLPSSTGDLVLKTTPTEEGKTGGKYIVHGYRCIEGDDDPGPGIWRELRAFTENGFARQYLSGTALGTGDFVLSANWGDDRDVVGITGDDSHAQFTIRALGANQGADPTITLTFRDGTWTTAPFALVVRNGGHQPSVLPTWTTTATTLVITFPGTPVVSQTFTFTFHVMGV